MDPSNPFMGMDPQMMQQLFAQMRGGGGAPGGGGIPGAMPNQMATGAQMPGAGGLASQIGKDPQKAEQLQKMGKLLSALGQFHQPPKPGAAQPGPPQAQPPQMPQMTQGAGGMQRPMSMQMPMQGQSTRPQSPMMGMGMNRAPDMANRLMTSLSAYGG